MENGFVGCAEGVRFLFDRADTRYGGLRRFEVVLHYGRCKKAWLRLPASIVWLEGYVATRYEGFANLKSLCTTVGGKRCGLAYLQAGEGWKVMWLRRSLRARVRATENGSRMTGGRALCF